MPGFMEAAESGNGECGARFRRPFGIFHKLSEKNH